MHSRQPPRFRHSSARIMQPSSCAAPVNMALASPSLLQLLSPTLLRSQETRKRILQPPTLYSAYLLGLLAMIKCSICSYQCDNWYVSNWRLACHMNVSAGSCCPELAQAHSSVALAWHAARGSTPFGVTCRQSCARAHDGTLSRSSFPPPPPRPSPSEKARMCAQRRVREALTWRVT